MYTEREALSRLVNNGAKDLPSFREGTVTQTGIDTSVTVLELDVREYRTLGILLINQGSNDLDVRVQAYYHSESAAYKLLNAASTTVSASAWVPLNYDVSFYSKIKIVAAAATAGSPSDLKIDYTLKT